MLRLLIEFGMNKHSKQNEQSVDRIDALPFSPFAMSSCAVCRVRVLAIKIAAQPEPGIERTPNRGVAHCCRLRQSHHCRPNLRLLTDRIFMSLCN